MLTMSNPNSPLRSPICRIFLMFRSGSTFKQIKLKETETIDNPTFRRNNLSYINTIIQKRVPLPMDADKITFLDNSLNWQLSFFKICNRLKYTFINLAPPKNSSCLRREVLTKRETYVAFPSLMRRPWIILQIHEIDI